MREVERLLKQHKFVLVSRNRHAKFRNPEGRVYVQSLTPSDWRVWYNRLQALKRALAELPPASDILETEKLCEEVESEQAEMRGRRAASGAGSSRCSINAGSRLPLLRSQPKS